MIPHPGPLELNAILAFLVVLYFLIQGSFYYPSITGEDNYFLYDRKLENRELAATFTAASTSLATVLFFFMTFSVEHGVFLLIAPASLLFGIYLFVRYFLPNLKETGFFADDAPQAQGRPTLGTTLASLIRERFDDKAVEYSVVAVTVIGLLAVLLIELFVGVSIFSIYLQEEYVDYALILIGVVVFIYSGLGGFPAVVETDRKQIKLVFTATSLLLGWLIWQGIGSSSSSVLDALVVHGPFFSGGFLLPYALLFNIIVVNLLLPPALLRTWQMTAAAPSAKEASRGLFIGALYTVGLTCIFILIGTLFYSIGFPETELELPALLQALASSDAQFASYVLFPLLFAACLAALLSTADSAILPLLQTYWNDLRGGEDDVGRWKLGELLLIDLLMLALAMGLYFVVFRILKFDLISWLFTIFSLLILATPAIAFGVLGSREMIRSKGGRAMALVSIWGGFVLAIVLSVVGNHIGELWMVQLNSPVAASFATICLGGYWYYHRQTTSHEDSQV